MTPEEHQAEHIRLHRALDELLGCWISEERYPLRRRSIHNEILVLLTWAYEKTLFPSPVSEDLPSHSPEPQFLIAQNDDPELLEWLTNAANKAGSFVQNLAWAGLRADSENYPMIRLVLMAMRRKYTEYEPSDAVKEEIRQRVKS